MILIWLILLLIAGGILAWVSGRWNDALPRWIALTASGVVFLLTLFLWIQDPGESGNPQNTPWLVTVERPWIPQLGISFSLALDGLSLLLVLLTSFIGVVSVAVSWSEIKERVGFFHFNLLWILAGIVGVFVAVDLFLFFFFWEMMLVPMYFLIVIWGHENRTYAAVKFFIFTQASGLLMFISILALYFLHGHQTGTYTFLYSELLKTTVTGPTATWLMLGFFIAFVVKLPAVPFHTWLPDAHTQAPTAGSVVLAALLLKTGAYGLIRFVVPLFPAASHSFAPLGMFLGVLGILYGAKLAFSQNDFKRLVAYTSVSHMGFVLLGVFAWNELALQGVIMQIICHAFSTGALFILAGILQHRIHTRDMDRMGGLWAKVPRMGAVALFFALASLGLPGLGNFVGEFLVLLGTFQVSVPWTVTASFGIIAATVYSLWIIQRAFHGEPREELGLSDLNTRDMAVLTAMIAVILWLGLFPQSVLNTARPALDNLQRKSVTAAAVEIDDGGTHHPKPLRVPLVNVADLAKSYSNESQKYPDEQFSPGETVDDD